MGAKTNVKKQSPVVTTVTQTAADSLEVFSQDDLPPATRTYTQVFDEWISAAKTVLIWVPIARIPVRSGIDLSFSARPRDAVTDTDSSAARKELYRAGRKRSWPKDRMVFSPLPTAMAYPEFVELYINGRLEWCYLVGAFLPSILKP